MGIHYFVKQLLHFTRRINKAIKTIEQNSLAQLNFAESLCFLQGLSRGVLWGSSVLSETSEEFYRSEID